MNFTFGTCCCDNSIYELYGPFELRAGADPKRDYYYISPLVWPVGSSIIGDNSFTLDGWKIDTSDEDDENPEKWNHFTLRPVTTDESNLCFGVRNSGLSGTGDTRVFCYNPDTETEIFTHDYEITYSPPFIGDTLSPYAFLADTMWSTWRVAEERNGGEISNSALNLSNYGSEGSAIYLYAPLGDQLCCNEDMLVFYQPIWYNSGERFGVATTFDSSDVTFYATQTLEEDWADDLLVTVESGLTSPDTPDRLARIQVVCPRLYPYVFGVKPPVQWQFNDWSPTQETTIDEEVELWIGEMTLDNIGECDITGPRAELVFSRERTRSGYSFIDGQRLNANMIAGDVTVDAEDNFSWGCAFFWGEEVLSGPNTLDTTEGNIEVVHNWQGTGKETYLSFSVSNGDNTRYRWCDYQMIHGTNYAVGIQGIGPLGGGAGFYWRMHCIDLENNVALWTTDSMQTGVNLDDPFRWTQVTASGRLPWIVGHNDEVIGVCNFPRPREIEAEDFSLQEENWRIRISDGAFVSKFTDGWNYNDPDTQRGEKVDMIAFPDKIAI